MSRAALVGNRLIKLQGGIPSPVFLVVSNNANQDLERGVRGNEVSAITEIHPRPVLKRVTGEQLTKQSVILQIGDYQTQIATDQLTEVDIKLKNVFIKVGGSTLTVSDGSLFRIVHYVIRYTAGSIVCFDIFLRGAVS